MQLIISFGMNETLRESFIIILGVNKPAKQRKLLIKFRSLLLQSH